MRNAHEISVGKPEGRTPPGRPRCTREDNIKIDVREIKCGSGWGLMAGCCECGNEPSETI
jgi:hypothetical protein